MLLVKMMEGACASFAGTIELKGLDTIWMGVSQALVVRD